MSQRKSKIMKDVELNKDNNRDTLSLLLPHVAGGFMDKSKSHAHVLRLTAQNEMWTIRWTAGY